MFDSLPVPVRDLLLLVVPVLLGWAGDSLVPWLSDQHPALSYALAALVSALTAWLTPVVRQYGVGSAKAAQDAPEHRA